MADASLADRLNAAVLRSPVQPSACKLHDVVFVGSKRRLSSNNINLSPDAAAPETPNIVVQWDNAALQGVRDSKIGPPMVARALAIVHTCMYDAWAAYDDRARGTQLGVSSPWTIPRSTGAAVLQFRHADGSNQLGNMSPAERRTRITRATNL